MADNEPTLTVDQSPPVDPVPGDAPTAHGPAHDANTTTSDVLATAGGETAGPETDGGETDGAETDGGETDGGFPFDEQTLGRSSSVFDAGVDLVPPMSPPSAAPPLTGPPMMGPPMVTQAPTADPAPERPLTQRERRRRVRLEARRVRRIVRHIEPWSVLKISVLFYFCLWLIFVLAGVLLWSFAESSGTLESIEDLAESLLELEESEEFWSGGTIFRAYAIGTLILSIAGVTFNVLLCVLYNLISDLTGGIRMTVIEEESARFTPPRRRARR